MDNSKQVIYRIQYSGGNSKELRDRLPAAAVLDFVLADKSICILRLNGWIRNITIICIYMPNKNMWRESEAQFLQHIGSCKCRKVKA